MSADCIHAVQQVARPVGAHDANRDQPCLPLSMRKTNLARLLARRPDGIFVAPTEQGEIGADLARPFMITFGWALCTMLRTRPTPTKHHTSIATDCVSRALDPSQAIAP
jgi:hypothetical protein